MTEHAFDHVVRTDTGSKVATVRGLPGGNTTRVEWRDASGGLLLVARIDGPGATRVLDAAGQDVACSDPRGSDAVQPAIRVIGTSVVVRSCEVAGHPAWIIDDYGNRERHFVFGCTSELFLHAHLDADGSITLAEKTRTHATLRTTVRRAGNGALVADQAVVQPGETLEQVARRCGTTADALRTIDPNLSDLPAAGTQVRLA